MATRLQPFVAYAQRGLQWLNPAHYGLLPGLLIPLVGAVLASLLVIQFLEDYVDSAHQTALIEQRGAIRLDGVAERVDDRRRSLLSVAGIAAASPTVATLLERGDLPRLHGELATIQNAFELTAIRVYGPDSTERAALGPAGVPGPAATLVQAALAGQPGSALAVSENALLVQAVAPLPGGRGALAVTGHVPLTPGHPIDIAFVRPGEPLFTTATSPQLQMALASAGPSGDLASMDQALRPLAYQVIARPLAGGKLLALVPTSDVAAAADLIGRVRVVVNVVLLAAVTVIAIRLAIRFRRSMRSIVAATVDVARGNYERRVEVGEVKELAHLGIAVNRMAEQLESRLGEIERRSSYDVLTNLPNRDLFMRRVDRALARRASAAGSTVGVLFVDLDDFKVVNDTMGHRAGDELLIRVSDLLLSCVRQTDTVARLSGDEFGLLLEEAEDTDQVVAVAQRILHRLAKPMRLNGRQHFLKASIGVATATAGSMSSGTLVRNADLAMQKAKKAGKNRYALYSADLLQTAWERLQVETDLRRAVAEGQLRLYYQPVVDLATGRVAGAEALLRWQHPARGLLTPDKFVDVAEDAGLIVDLERWAHQEAAHQLHAWQQLVGADHALSMNMNLSPRQFQFQNLAERVMEAMAPSGVRPSDITLEITEQTAVEMAESNVAALQALRDAGFNLAIDDFGVGHSALRYFKQFPVNAVKIDRSFVNGLGKDPTDTAIVQAMLSFAKALHLKVTAEGVETEEQLAILRDLGCERGQGYLFGKPLPSESFEALLLSSLAPSPEIDAVRRTLEAARRRLAA